MEKNILISKKTNNIFGILIVLSFVPLAVVICISLYYSVKGHVYYSWFDPGEASYTAYGFEEFCNSMLYYGGYLTFRIPVFEICFGYQVFYIFNMKKFRRNGE